MTGAESCDCSSKDREIAALKAKNAELSALFNETCALFDETHARLRAELSEAREIITTLNRAVNRGEGE